MLECGPPTEHRSGAEMKLLPDGTYHLACGSTEMGNGITTAHKQIAAVDRRRRAPSDVDIINADTDRTPYDTGTFASTGTVVAGKAVHMTAEAMRDDILDFAARHTGVDRDQCRLDNDAVICGNKRILLTELHAAGRQGQSSLHGRAARPTCRRAPSPSTCRACGSPCIASPARSASCTACMPPTSARPINPMQCRGQLDGAVAMGYRLGADREHGP